MARSCVSGIAVAAVGVLVVSVGAAAGAGRAADPAFSPSGPVHLGSCLCAVATADFNGDGNADFAFPDSGSGRVSVLLEDGTGGFHVAAGSPIAAGQKPSAVVAGDFNGDGKPDLAVADSGADTVSVLLGDGSGGLRPAPGLPVGVGDVPIDLTAADLDGDGKVDLLVRVRAKVHERLAILLGNGSGRFAPAAGSPLVVAETFDPTAVADVNGDSKPDLVVGRGEASGISILPGQGAGRFGAARQVPAGHEADLVAVADFNGDGKPDIAVTNVAADSVTLLVRVLVGNGRGGFSPAAGPRTAVGGIGTSAAVADLNGDGKLDLVVADGAEISVLIGNGTGSLHPAADSPFPLDAVPFFGGPYPNGIFAVDLNGDGKTDVALPGWTHDGEELTPMLQTPPTPAISPARTPPQRRDAVFSTRGTITMLAADGNQVAAATQIGKGLRLAKFNAPRICGPVVVWTAPGRRSVSFKSRVGCGDSTIPIRIDELALGGGQVAWIDEGGGNDLELTAYVAKLSGRAPKQIDWVVSNADSGEGNWVGQLLGAGPLLAYDGWQLFCKPSDPNNDTCTTTSPTARLGNQRLVRIAGGRGAVVKRGSDAFALVAVGGGRMAVESGVAVDVLGPDGTQVATVPADVGNPPREIALSSTRLAVEHTFTLELYDPGTGTRTKSIALGGAAALHLTAINSKLALLQGPRRMVLVRLSDGKLISLPLLGRTTGVIDPKLTEAGLFQAYNVPRASAKGRIVFEPTATLLTRF